MESTESTESMKHCLSTAHGVHYISESVYGLHVQSMRTAHEVHMECT